MKKEINKEEESKITVSLIKADVGGFPGHSTVHPALEKKARECMEIAVQDGLLESYYVLHAGDDLELVMSHRNGVDNKEVHALSWDTFLSATEVAKELKLHGAGQDLLVDAFSGNIRGMGPGIAEMEFMERGSEPLVAYMMDKTEPGAFNYAIYKIFADPFNTAGLVIDPTMHDGFVFEVWDIKEKRKVYLKTPEELYSLLALIGAKSRYVVKRVFPKESSPIPAEEPVAVISTEKLFFTAGKYVGKDDPVALVRSQGGLPALGEVLEPFSLPYLVSGWMRGSHNGPIMPVPFKYSQCTRFDGPPRVIAAGFQVSHGKLVGVADLFNDPAFDLVRVKAQKVADYMRAHGPFEPHRLPMEEMEYTTLPSIMSKLKGRFVSTE